MNLQDAPINRKLRSAIMLTSTVVILLTASVFVIYEIFAFRGGVLQNSKTIAEITAAQSTAAVDFENEQDGDEILSKLAAEPRILLAALYTKNGAMLSHYPMSAAISAFPAKPEDREYWIEYGAVNLFVPIVQDHEVIGALYLRWGLSSAYRRIAWYGGMVALILVGTLIVALVISNKLRRRISEPILELAETARAVSFKRDYRVRAKRYGNDELGLLTDAFNHMLTQIHERDEALRANEEQLRRALQSAQASAEQVQALNAELEKCVSHRTAQLASSNQELEAFTYSVSHDLRAPLRHIDAYAQILEEEGMEDSASAKKYIARIRSGVQNMGNLVDDLLNLSRVGRADVNYKTVALGEMVEEVVAQIKPELKDRRIEWKIGPLPSVRVDPGLIRQVFINLISNAVKYSRPRDPAVIEIGQEKVNGVATIFVRDNGVGFNMKYYDKLFGVFQRLHRAEDFEGTGVGLATVQRIIQLHGGKIWADAELDKGATFHFTLQGIDPAL